MDNLPIILVVVGVAAVLVYFLFFRKKTDAPDRESGPATIPFPGLGLRTPPGEPASAEPRPARSLIAP